MKRGKDYDYSAVAALKAAGEKSCTKCGILKPFSDFHVNSHHPTRLKSECKVCASERFRRYRYSDIEKRRRLDRVSAYLQYGLSKEQAEKLVENRIGVCEICGDKKPLVVDHNHSTNALRGLICSACNSVLGYAKEKSLVLESAIKYLEKHNGKG